jgi:hypothetical protein
MKWNADLRIHSLETRNKIRKAFLKETKAKNMKYKIQNEIAKLGEEVFEKSWGDY